VVNQIITVGIVSNGMVRVVEIGYVTHLIVGNTINLVYFCGLRTL